MVAIIGANASAVPIDEAKAFLRIAGSDEDALLAAMIRSATGLCEAFTGLALIERDVEEMLPARPVWTRLGQSPVRSIAQVFGLPASGEAGALAPEDYAVDIDAAGDGWARILRGEGFGRVRVHYRAGQAPDWNGIAEPLRHGILRMAAHLYTHRDPEDGAGPPAAVTALWLPYRRLRLR
ncbi:head-tail connector protein [Allosphingosinicella sp.]|jgi:uncharacterized phiE125 gp8 family phage protein|uniref:head-tail connector protein n=1 Tax=Allosphingosinicella sp. TaxID=2823234 RepID=UPI002EF37E12